MLDNLIDTFFFELEIWLSDLNIDFTLKNYLFQAFKLTKNADCDLLILDMIFDLIHDHVFQFQILIFVKLLLFFL